MEMIIAVSKNLNFFSIIPGIPARPVTEIQYFRTPTQIDLPNHTIIDVSFRFNISPPKVLFTLDEYII